MATRPTTPTTASPAALAAGLATTPTISTEELAAAIGVTPGTLRTRLCRAGSYFGLRPLKMPNRMLRWPADAVEQLLAGGSADPLDAPPAASKRPRRSLVPRATPIIDAGAGV